MTSAPARSSTPEADDDYEPDPKRWKALTVCLVAGFMTLLDVSIVNVALPSIQSGIHAGENSLSWVVSGYALAFGLLLVPAGRVGDARGRRPSFMAGLSLFTLASAACGFAPNAGFLITARLVQGFAGGVVTPQVSGLIQNLFRGKERAKAFGFFGATVGISTAVGPLVGGALIQIFGNHTGWRYVFFVNVPIGLVALPLARALIPHAPRSTEKKENTDYDPVGVVLLGIAVLLVILPFIEQQTWHSAVRPLLFPVAAVVFGIFLFWEHRYRKRDHEAFRSTFSTSKRTTIRSCDATARRDAGILATTRSACTKRSVANGRASCPCDAARRRSGTPRNSRSRRSKHTWSPRTRTTERAACACASWRSVSSTAFRWMPISSSTSASSPIRTTCRNSKR